MRKLRTILPVVFMSFVLGAMIVAPVSKDANASSSLIFTQDEEKVKEKAKERLQSMYKKLEMDRDQYDEAWTVVYDYVGDLSEIKKEAGETGNEDEAFDRWKEIKENYKDSMKDILNEDQYKQFAEGKWETEDRESLEAALQ